MHPFFEVPLIIAAVLLGIYPCQVLIVLVPGETILLGVLTAAFVYLIGYELFFQKFKSTSGLSNGVSPSQPHLAPLVKTVTANRNITRTETHTWTQLVTVNHTHALTSVISQAKATAMSVFQDFSDFRRDENTPGYAPVTDKQNHTLTIAWVVGIVGLCCIIGLTVWCFSRRQRNGIFRPQAYEMR